MDTTAEVVAAVLQCRVGDTPYTHEPTHTAHRYLLEVRSVVASIKY